MHTHVTQIYAKPQMSAEQVAAFARALGAVVNSCIAVLDVLANDPDLEVDNPAESDGCDQDSAWLERVNQSRQPLLLFADHWSGLGASEDAEPDDAAEDDDPRELNGDEGDYSDGDCGHCAQYSIDQTTPVGPDNLEAA